MGKVNGATTLTIVTRTTKVEMEMDAMVSTIVSMKVSNTNLVGAT